MDPQEVGVNVPPVPLPLSTTLSPENTPPFSVGVSVTDSLRHGSVLDTVNDGSRLSPDSTDILCIT